MSDAKIILTADSAQAEASVRKLGDSVQGLGRRFADLTGLAGGLAGALSITAFASFVQNTVNGIDALNDLSDATGASIGNLSALEDIAARTGTSMDVVGTALVKLNKTLEDAKPDNAAGLALKQIGLNAEELKKLDPAEALRQTALALDKYADDGNKARLVQELFGKSMREVAPLLKDLAQGGELLAKVTKEQAEQAEAFNKQLFELKKNAVDASRALFGDLITGLNAAGKAMKESGFMEGLTTLFYGDDAFRNSKAIVENTDKLWRLENSLLKARSEGYAETSRYVQNIKAQIEQTKTALNTNISYARVLENGVTGQPKTQGAEKASVGELVDPIQRAKAEAEKKRRAAEREKQRIKAQQDEEKRVADLMKPFEGYSDSTGDDAVAAVNLAMARVNKAEEDAAAASDTVWQQSVARRLAQIQTSNMSEQELARGNLAAIQADLEAALNQGFITRQQYSELLYQETIKSQAALGNVEAQGIRARMRFEQMTSKQKTQAVLNDMLSITNSVASQSRALFNINKLAGIANATIFTAEGVANTMRRYPYPFNLPMAALHLAAGLAQIQQIKSAQFGSSTSAPSIAGGTAAPVFDATSSGLPTASLTPPNENVVRPRQRMEVTLVGDAFSYDNVVNVLIPKFNEAAENGVDIVVRRG